MSRVSRVASRPGRDGRLSASSSTVSTASRTKKSDKAPARPVAPELTRPEQAQAAAAWSVISHKQDTSSTDKSRHSLLDTAHLLGYNPSKREIREFQPNKASFTLNDLFKFIRPLDKLDQAAVYSGFRIMDEDGDGELSKQELIDHLTNYGERMSTDEVDAVMSEFDVDGDGNLDYTEFCQMIASFGNAARIHFEPTVKEPAIAGGLGASRLGTGRAQQSDTQASAGRAVAEPESNLAVFQQPDDLKNWDGDRLNGMFQASSGGRVCSQQYGFQLTEPTEVFISLRSHHSMGIRSEEGDTALVDVRFYVAKIVHGDDGFPEICGASLLHADSEVCLRISLDAGAYRIIPFSTGCYLRKRQREGKLAPLTYDEDGNTRWTDRAHAMLQHAFDRFDFDGTGTISQSEYSMLQTITDGKTCDETTWQQIKDEFETIEGEITFKGFCDLFMLFVEDVDDEAALLEFFENFEKLGFSRDLEPDELAKFKMFLFTKKHNIHEIYVLPIDEVRVQQVDLIDILQCGQGQLVKDGLYMYVRKGRHHQSIAFKNLGGDEAAYTVDFTGSENVITNLGSLKVNLKIPAGGAALCCHLMPARQTREWKVDVVFG